MKQVSAPTSKSCGECNLCCIELPIETPELRKKAQMPCSHLTSKGCGIYTTRFPICRQFLCGWMLFPELDADWRPDRSGVMILQVPQVSIPKIYQPAGHGVQLLITGGEAAVTRPGFAEYIVDQVSRGVAVYMTATTPRALLNEYLQPIGGNRPADHLASVSLADGGAGQKRLPEDAAAFLSPACRKTTRSVEKLTTNTAS
jgi:hypothetical protein